jgi:hypothetical protein
MSLLKCGKCGRMGFETSSLPEARCAYCRARKEALPSVPAAAPPGPRLIITDAELKLWASEMIRPSQVCGTLVYERLLAEPIIRRLAEEYYFLGRDAAQRDLIAEIEERVRSRKEESGPPS